MLTDLSKVQIARLASAGAVDAVYGTSTTPKWLGDLVQIDFLDSEGRSVGHITQMSEEPVTHAPRPYNPEIKGSRRHNHIFSSLVQELETLSDSSTYRIV